MSKQSLYTVIIERIFLSHFKTGAEQVNFAREDIVKFAKKLGVPLPKNLGDVVYSFRYRKALPRKILTKAKKGYAWIIRPAGRGKYCFVLVPDRPLSPNEQLAITKIPDSTPGIVAKYSLTDEQALLAKVRYNRLIDTFMGITCYSLQNHCRTTVPALGQVETDEIYVGIDKKGAQYVCPVQGKGLREQFGVVQIEQDLELCAHKFPSLTCRPIGAKSMEDNIIALLEFEQAQDGIHIASEKHYKLVPPEDVTVADLNAYRNRRAD